eukprot:352554-Chlamydomonas_euryale.AAC.5
MGPPGTLPWPQNSWKHIAESPRAQAPCGGGDGLQRPAAGVQRPAAGAVALGKHALAGHARPRLCRLSPSLRCTGDQRPHHRPAAAAARQRPRCLPAPGHRHGQTAGRHPVPDSSDV